MTKGEASPFLCDYIADDLQSALAGRIVKMIGDNCGIKMSDYTTAMLTDNAAEMIGGFIDRHYGDEEPKP